MLFRSALFPIINGVAQNESYVFRKDGQLVEGKLDGKAETLVDLPAGASVGDFLLLAPLTVSGKGELGWRADKPLNGPWDILKSKSHGGHFPFEINYLQVGDAVVVGIYLFFIGLNVFMWSWWQKRGKKAGTEVATSTYGRPLVKKA